MSDATITLTIEECKAIHSLIDMLSGGNPENVFDWEGNEDDPNDPDCSVCVKIYLAAGYDVPAHLKGDYIEPR